MRTFTLRPLIEDDIKAVILRALKDKENGYGLSGLSLSKSALAHLLNASGCDPRCALDNLELVMDAISDSALEIGMPEVVIISTTTEQVSDKYDFLSAFHKSIRGSDTNAALLWLGTLLHQVDCDVKEITRRLLAICSEDVGIKDHYATSIVLSHIDAYERLGPAEGERALAQAVIYLCAAPKSNIVYKSWDNVKAIIEKNNLVVPNHLKNASTKQARDLGYGVGYEKPLRWF
ncbi:hypothetical protein [Photobacterium leiognathi]|uniref:AAA family ATPase n=1 Tax=Photobacterium leiognathi TaxID=553611 RepID=UPI001EDE584B